jgi:peptide/nickel transport system permease protein
LTIFSFKRFFKNRFSVWGIGYILLLLVLSIWGSLIAPDKSKDANQQNISLRFKKPGFEYVLNNNLIPVTIGKLKRMNDFSRPLPICKDSLMRECNQSRLLQEVKTQNYFLGTDGLGRDVLSRLIIGTRVSMLVGLIAVIISLLIGVVTGSLAGYYGGTIDRFISWLMNVFWAIPTVLLAMVLIMSFNPKNEHQLGLVFFAVGLTMWVDTARLIRGLFMQLKERQFVEATKALGFSDMRIIFKHIIPNTIPSLIVITSSNFASAILMESGLSYLGLGVQPPAPSWGSMLREYYSYLGTDVSYLAFFPGLAITLAVLSFYALGSGLRDALDVKG